MALAEHPPKQLPSASEEAWAILNTLPPRTSDVLQRWVAQSPDHVALVESSGTWSYAQLAAALTDTATWLQNLNVRPGDRVMLIGENCRAFIAVLLALSSIDAWPVLVNPRLSAREVDEIRDHCGARRLIYTTSVSVQARDHAKRHAATQENPAHLGPLHVSPLNENTETEPIDPDPTGRVAALIYTSGTTGRPKGVMLTHKNVLFVAAGSAKIRSLAPEDRLYAVLPMSHAVGLSVVLLGSLISGATLYLAPRFDPVAALASLTNQKLTVLLGAPALFNLIVEYTRMKGIASLKFADLRVISSSGAPLSPPLKHEVEKLFGMTLHNGYGVTECSPNIAQTRMDAPRTDVSVGLAFPGTELQLVGPDLMPVPEGEVGELWVRGPNVMKGYYRSPEDTAEAVNAEGWFNTRDLARLERASLFIAGRSKELIVRFGFNVYPAEIEAILNAHPGVTRSAVVGRSAAGDGNEEVIAFVEPTPARPVSVAELTKYTAQNLAPYKQPSQIIVVANLPMTPTGKVIKGELKNLPEFAQNIS